MQELALACPCILANLILSLLPRSPQKRRLVMKVANVNHAVHIELNEFELGLLNNCLHFALLNLSEEECERRVGASRAELKQVLEALHDGFES
jgi:hypothetical protein